eukprot:TRINITY_DN34215_c0_g1_i1.p2 TRINITY_DN34215_c0_g1~~TRINITY_DN34215_c0_g1_i1.p2  ORF type:complete len:329 (-),score=49.53 TRINITY_DN34215_c0_g1_i1:385-1350(-)
MSHRTNPSSQKLQQQHKHPKPSSNTEELEEHRSKFPIWHSALRSGFSLLLYGVGSKLSLLDEFHDKELVDGGKIRVVGYSGIKMNLKQFLVAVIQTLGCYDHEKCKGYSVQKLMQIIRECPEDRRMYLVVHNMEGGNLREFETQKVFAQLASMENIHLVASVDHINSDMMWDSELLEKFNWFRQHVPTYLPYAEEIKGMPKGKKEVHNKSNRQRVKTVLSTLPTPARKVYLMLGQHALENPDDTSVLFQDLYEECQRQWVLNNEQTLRSYLTEFLDHDLVVRGEEEGEEERLQIALEEPDLEKVVEDLEDEFDEKENQQSQ